MAAYYIAILSPLFCSCYSNYSSFYVTACVATVLHQTLLLVVRDHRYFPLNSSCTICTDSLSPSVWSNWYWYHTIIPLCSTNTECMLHVSLQTFARENEATRIHIYTWARRLHLLAFHAHCECADIKCCVQCVLMNPPLCLLLFTYHRCVGVLAMTRCVRHKCTHQSCVHSVCTHLFICEHTQQSLIFILC